MLRFIAVIPENIGYELKRRFKIRQLRKNISTTAYKKQLKKIRFFDIIMVIKSRKQISIWTNFQNG